MTALHAQEHSWNSHLLEAEHQGHSAAGRIRSIKKSSDPIGNWTHDPPKVIPEIN
jgi:hypothetical protein